MALGTGGGDRGFDLRGAAPLAARAGLQEALSTGRDLPYCSGKTASWIKFKNLWRGEFVIIGWTQPAGSREGFGTLQTGTYDEQGTLHYAGGVGIGFRVAVLKSLCTRIDPMALGRKPDMVISGEKPPRGITWVRPDLVAEISFTEWSNSGRLRHPMFIGLREDKPAGDVMGGLPSHRKPTEKISVAEPPVPRASKIVMARAPRQIGTDIASIQISHADRQLWPGVTKQALAEYWNTMAKVALPGIAHRPLAILRCPDSIDSEQFFQKHRSGFMPAPVREGSSQKQPYLAIDDVSGMIAMAQMSAIELHTWGADEADPQHPDCLVFDLDPGEGVVWKGVVAAAHTMRARLETIGLASCCRTSGGKGLHVVVPLDRSADWPTAKTCCRSLVELISAEEPKRFLAHTKIADRKGRIVIDWLRNGPGATVATPLDRPEVTESLDFSTHTIVTMPARMAKQPSDPWAAFSTLRQGLPKLVVRREAQVTKPRSRIAVASKPKKK